MASGVLAIRHYNMFPDLLLVYDANEAAAVPKNNEKILAIYDFTLNTVNIEKLSKVAKDNAKAQNPFVLYVYGNDKDTCADGETDNKKSCPTVVAKQLGNAYVQFVQHAKLSSDEQTKLAKSCHATGSILAGGKPSTNSSNAEAGTLLKKILDAYIES